MSWSLSLLIFFLAFFPSLAFNPDLLFIFDPARLSQALLAASLPLGVFATTKFITATLLLLGPAGQSTLEPARSSAVALAYSIFTLLQLASSIATLITVFR
jgi:hypothetical protein